MAKPFVFVAPTAGTPANTAVAEVIAQMGKAVGGTFLSTKTLGDITVTSTDAAAAAGTLLGEAKMIAGIEGLKNDYFANKHGGLDVLQKDISKFQLVANPKAYVAEWLAARQRATVVASQTAGKLLEALAPTLGPTKAKEMAVIRYKSLLAQGLKEVDALYDKSLLKAAKKASEKGP